MPIGQYFKNKPKEPERRYEFMRIDGGIRLVDTLSGAVVRATVPSSGLCIDEKATGWTFQSRGLVELPEGYMAYAALKGPEGSVRAVFYGQDKHEARLGALIGAITQIP